MIPEQLNKLSRWLVVIAHYDDEAMFLGGTLCRLKTIGATVQIVVLTGVQYCNPPVRPEAYLVEQERQAARLGAFARVCMDVGATAIHIGAPQITEVDADKQSTLTRLVLERVQRTIRAFGPEAIITHGDDGAIAHPQHAWTRKVVTRAARGVPVLQVALEGEVQLDINLEAKMRLLNYYRYGTTQTEYWDPTDNAEYRKWITDVERFTLC